MTHVTKARINSSRQRHVQYGEISPDANPCARWGFLVRRTLLQYHTPAGRGVRSMAPLYGADSDTMFCGKSNAESNLGI